MRVVEIPAPDVVKRLNRRLEDEGRAIRKPRGVRLGYFEVNDKGHIVRTNVDLESPGQAERSTGSV